MAEANRRIQHFTLVEEYDVTALEETRQMMNRDRGSNPKLTLLPFLITALSRGLAEWPMLNATFDDEAMVVTRHGSVQMGVATQTTNGLMVATIRDAQRRSVWELASEILRLSDAARSNKATREELSGATFTVSSLGPMGGITSTPVVNPPQVAIVAVNKIEDKIVPVDDEIEVRKRMNLSLSCDHRVIDGWDAASFMQTLKGYIENPIRLLSLPGTAGDGAERVEPETPAFVRSTQLYFFPSSRQLFSLTSTPYLSAAFLIRFHAASRSSSLTPFTWSKRAIALRTWLASSSGSLRSLGKANLSSSRLSRCFSLSSTHDSSPSRGDNA